MKVETHPSNGERNYCLGFLLRLLKQNKNTHEGCDAGKQTSSYKIHRMYASAKPKVFQRLLIHSQKAHSNPR